MGRDAGQYTLNFADFSGRWFVADEAGISRLKRQVRMRAKKRLWLRKGEDFGAVIQMLFEAYNSGPEAIEAMWDAYLASEIKDELAGLTLQSLLNNEPNWENWWKLYELLSKRGELIVKHAKQMKALLSAGADWVRGIEIRILFNPGEPDAPNVRAGLGWRALGCEIRQYRDKDTAGSHRYYLSEHEFAFFVRQPDKSFFGFHSDQSDVVEALTSAFDAEWKANEPTD